MIGTTRARVSHFMNKFRKLGYIDYNGHLTVHNSLLNVVLYDKPEIGTDDAPKRRAAARPASPVQERAVLLRAGRGNLDRTIGGVSA